MFTTLFAFLVSATGIMSAGLIDNKDPLVTAKEVESAKQVYAVDIVDAN
jgi:hypothetical protein